MRAAARRLLAPQQLQLGARPLAGTRRGLRPRHHAAAQQADAVHLRCCQRFGRHMLERGDGRIINLASIGSFAAYPAGNIAYLASKGEVAQLTRSLAVEWARRGVRVNAIAPTTMNTPLVRRLRPAGLQDSPVVQITPMARAGEPYELIGAAIYLASDASSLVTGHILAADGGYLVC